jgi:AmiR/NasT family two-component response regulator
MNQAFTLLRQHARSTNERLTDVARYVIDSPTADFPPQPQPRG